MHFQQDVALKILPTDRALHFERLLFEADSNHRNQNHKQQAGNKSKKHNGIR